MIKYQAEGYTTIAPWVVTDDTGALLDFVAAAFDGVELGRVVVEDGSIGHGEIRVGDTVLLAFDRRPEWPSMPALLRVFVPDADAAMAKAVSAGAPSRHGSIHQRLGSARRSGSRPVRQHLVGDITSRDSLGGGVMGAPRPDGLCGVDAGRPGDPRRRVERTHHRACLRADPSHTGVTAPDLPPSSYGAQLR
jgi:hypothetical protein